MPTKYGLPLVQIWQELGVDFTPANLAQAQTIYDRTKIGFIYLPQHFVAAQEFVTFREQIGKRPPFATAELAWCPIVGDDKYIQDQPVTGQGLDKSRLMLHAYEIRFSLPDGSKKRLKAPYDERFKASLEKMELRYNDL